MRVAEPIHVQSWRGALALEFERRGGRTVMAARRHEGPLVVQKPFYPEGDGVCHTVLVHPPGGIAGGDELHIDAGAGAGTHVLLTTPAAGKWYRSAGPWARQRVTIEAAAASCIEWLPQETIVFDAALADMRVDVELAPDAAFIGWDILCLGRRGAGERYAKGECRVQTRIARAGTVVWFERGVMPAGGTFCTSPVGLGGRSVCGTFVAAAPAIDRALMDAARSEVAVSGTTAVTRMDGLLVARYLGDASEHARQYFQRIWSHVRPALTGRAAHAPRIWST